MRILLSILTFCVASVAQAGLYGTVDALYTTDAFTTTTNADHSRTYIALDLIANIDNNYKYYAGFHVHQYAFTDTMGTTKSSLSSLDMGPFLKWVIDRKRTFALSLGYNILATGSYNNGSQNAELSGTSILASFDITPEVSENLYIGVKFNYLAMSYAKSVVGSASSDVSYSRTVIFPSLSISWRR